MDFQCILVAYTILTLLCRNRGSGRLVSKAQVKTRLQQLKLVAKPTSLRGRLAKKGGSTGISSKKPAVSMSSDESSDDDNDEEASGSDEENNTSNKKAARRASTLPKRVTKKTSKRNNASSLSDSDRDDDDEGSEKSTGLDMYQHFSQMLPDEDDEHEADTRPSTQARASSYTEPQQSIDDLLDDVSFDDTNDDDTGNKGKNSAARYQSDEDDEDEAPLLQTLIKDYNSKIAKSLSTPYKPSSKPASDSATQATAIQIVSTASSTTAIPSRKRSDINSSDGEDSVINDKENTIVRVNKTSTSTTNKKRRLKKAKVNTRDSDEDEAMFASTSPSLQKRPRVDLPRNIPVSSLLDNGHDSDDGTWQGEAGAVDMLSKANTGYKPSSTAAASAAAATVGVSGGLKALQARAQARLTIFDSDDEEGEF